MTQKVTKASFGIFILGLMLAFFATSCSKSTTNANAAFVGVYAGTEVDNTVTHNDTITISAGSSSNAVNLLVRTSVPSTYSYSGSVSGSLLTIPSQAFAYGNAVDTISGGGTLTGTTLNITYSIKTSTGTFNWVYTGTLE